MRVLQSFSYRISLLDPPPISDKIGITPEKYLLSSTLKDSIPDIQMEINTQMNRYKRQPDYQCDYSKFKSPHGRVHVFKYQDVHFTLAGSQWEHVPNKNIHKLLIYSRPELIMLQIRPDFILKNFNPSYSKEFIGTIIRPAEEIMPNSLAQKISEELQIPLEFEDKYAPYQLNERIQLDKVATVCHYAIRNKILFREHLANQYTLPQLQQLFAKTCELVPLHPDIIPNTPMNVGYQLIPEILLRKSDEYQSTIVEYLAAKKTYKRVFGLFGNMQSDAINDLLERRSVSHLRDELAVSKIRKSMLKQLTCEDLVERHAILDLMSQGNVFKNFKSRKFVSTAAVIKKYADPHFVDHTRQQQMIYLHIEMMKKYSSHMKEYIDLGKQQLKREYMKRANAI